MPKSKTSTRVALTLPKNLDEPITQISKQTGIPKSTIITSLIKMSLPDIRHKLEFLTWIEFHPGLKIEQSSEAR